MCWTAIKHYSLSLFLGRKEDMWAVGRGRWGGVGVGSEGRARRCVGGGVRVW